MAQRRVFHFALLGVLLFSACDDGAQHGKFAVSRMSGVGAKSPKSEFVVFRGGSPHATTVRASTIPLLCVLVVEPPVIATGTGASLSDGTYISTYEWYWTTARGRIGMKLTWDRRTDKVSAGGMTFDRTKGNAFVLTQSPSGTIAASQVLTTITATDDVSAFKQFQSALPPSSSVAGLTLVP
jgi:hypothetical protein